MKRIMIADKQIILRDGLKAILERDEEIYVCGVAADVNEAYEMCAKETPDLLLIDIEMINGDGFKVMRRIKKEFSDVRILILTTSSDFEAVSTALSSGTNSYILKTVGEKELINIVKNAAAGYCVFDPDIEDIIRSKFFLNVDSVNASFGKLSDKDENMLFYLTLGKSNKEIANLMFLSEGRVKNRTTELMGRVGAENRTQLAVFFERNYSHVMLRRRNQV